VVRQWDSRPGPPAASPPIRVLPGAIRSPAHGTISQLVHQQQLQQGRRNRGDFMSDTSMRCPCQPRSNEGRSRTAWPAASAWVYAACEHCQQQSTTQPTAAQTVSDMPYSSAQDIMPNTDCGHNAYTATTYSAWMRCQLVQPQLDPHSSEQCQSVLPQRKAAMHDASVHHHNVLPPCTA
jgi:hypothetical protein